MLKDYPIAIENYLYSTYSIGIITYHMRYSIVNIEVCKLMISYRTSYYYYHKRYYSIAIKYIIMT